MKMMFVEFLEQQLKQPAGCIQLYLYRLQWFCCNKNVFFFFCFKKGLASKVWSMRLLLGEKHNMKNKKKMKNTQGFQEKREKKK